MVLKRSVRCDLAYSKKMTIREPTLMIIFFDLITSIWAQRFLQKSNALHRNFIEFFRIKQCDGLLKRKEHRPGKKATD